MIELAFLYLNEPCYNIPSLFSGDMANDLKQEFVVILDEYFLIEDELMLGVGCFFFCDFLLFIPEVHLAWKLDMQGNMVNIDDILV